jgi:hypothetical protein
VCLFVGSGSEEGVDINVDELVAGGAAAAALRDTSRFVLVGGSQQDFRKAPTKVSLFACFAKI